MLISIPLYFYHFKKRDIFEIYLRNKISTNIFNFHISNISQYFSLSLILLYIPFILYFFRLTLPILAYPNTVGGAALHERLFYLLHPLSFILNQHSQIKLWSNHKATIQTHPTNVFNNSTPEFNESVGGLILFNDWFLCMLMIDVRSTYQGDCNVK